MKKVSALALAILFAFVVAPAMSQQIAQGGTSPATTEITPEKFRPMLGTFENDDNRLPTKWTITSFGENGVGVIEYKFRDRKLESASATVSEAEENGKKVLKLTVKAQSTISSVEWNLTCRDAPKCEAIPSEVTVPGGRPTGVKIWRTKPK